MVRSLVQQPVREGPSAGVRHDRVNVRHFSSHLKTAVVRMPLKCRYVCTRRTRLRNTSDPSLAAVKRSIDWAGHDGDEFRGGGWDGVCVR